LKTGCDKYRRAMEEHFIGEKRTDPEDWEELQGHLRACKPCREFYDRLRQAEEMLAGGKRPVRPAEERLLQAVLPARAKAASWIRPVALAAAACLLLVVGAALIFRPESRKEFTARGEKKVPSGGAVRALCLTPDDAGTLAARPLPKAREPGEAQAGCPANGVLKLLLSNPPDGPAHLFVIGLTEAGEVRYYFPGPREPGSLPVERDVIDMSFGEGIRLEVNHEPGLVRIYSLFSSRTLTLDEVKTALKSGYAAKGSPPARLELERVVSQDNFWLRIAAPEGR
jgi:hypothetical protein